MHWLVGDVSIRSRARLMHISASNKLKQQESYLKLISLNTISIHKNNKLMIILVTIQSTFGWNSCTLATSCEELTHWKRLWCWEGLGAGREGDDRGWDGWMASLTLWTWVWANSGSWWRTGRPGVLRFMRWQRVGHDWATELNWTESI